MNDYSTHLRGRRRQLFDEVAGEDAECVGGVSGEEAGPPVAVLARDLHLVAHGQSQVALRTGLERVRSPHSAHCSTQHN